MFPGRTARSSVIFSTSQVSGSLIHASPVSGVPEGQLTPSIRVCSPALPPLGITVGGAEWGLRQTGASLAACRLLGAARLGRDWGARASCAVDGAASETSRRLEPCPAASRELRAAAGPVGVPWGGFSVLGSRAREHRPRPVACCLGQAGSRECISRSAWGHRRCRPRDWPPRVQCTASAARSAGCQTRGWLGVRRLSPGSPASGRLRWDKHTCHAAPRTSWWCFPQELCSFCF